MAASEEGGLFRPHFWSIDLNWLALHILLGAAVGLVVLGGGARLAMRLVALIADMPPSLTVTGTLGILVMGTVAGVILGLLYAPFGRWVPFAWYVNGLLFGVILACLTALPFIGEPEGEAALVAPWIGGSLFAALPLCFSLTLAFALRRIEPRFARVAPRRVSAIWFALYAAAFVFAFVSMASVVDQGRVPTVLRRALEGAGVPFHALRDAHGMLYLVLMLFFFGLHLTAFWLGARRRLIQAISLAQLVLAGLVLRTDPLWQRLAATDAGSAGEWLAWLLLVTGFAIGIGWLLRQRALESGPSRHQWTWLAGGVACFVGGFLLAWLAVLLAPDLQLRNWTAVQTVFTVPPLVLPWLGLPAALIGAAAATGHVHA